MLVGVDFGGTKIRAALVNNFKIKKEITVLTDVKHGKKQILKNLFEAVDYVFDKRVSFIGVGVAGTTDGKKILNAVNIKPLNNVKLAQIISKRYKVPCMLENDVNAFVIAEYSLIKQKQRKVRNVVGITLGTGVGGGLILEGKLYKGSNYSASELGHMTIASNRIKCSCGNYDCFEVYCNGKAIERYYYKLTNKRVSSYDIVKNYDKDLNARKSLREYSKYLGIALVNITNIFNPEYIVIGGGISRVKQIYKPAINYLRKHALKDSRMVKVKRSFFGKDAVVIGAAMLRKLEPKLWREVKEKESVKEKKKRVRKRKK